VPGYPDAKAHIYSSPMLWQIIGNNQLHWLTDFAMVLILRMLSQLKHVSVAQLMQYLADWTDNQLINNFFLEIMFDYLFGFQDPLDVVNIDLLQGFCDATQWWICICIRLSE